MEIEGNQRVLVTEGDRAHEWVSQQMSKKD